MTGRRVGIDFTQNREFCLYHHFDNSSGEHRILIFRSSLGLLASEALGSPHLRPTHCRRKDSVNIYPNTYTYPGRLLMNSGDNFISSTDGKGVTLHAMRLRGGLEI